MAERVEVRTGEPPRVEPYPRLRPISQPAKAGLRAYGLWVLALDAAAMLVGASLAQTLHLGRIGGTGPLELSSGMGTVAVTIAWLVTLALSGAYDRRCFGDGSDEYRRVLNAAVRFMAVVAIIAFIAKYDVARGFVAIAIPLSATLTLAARYGARRWMQIQRSRRRFTKRVLVVGSEPTAADLARVLRATSFAGLDVVAACLSSGPARLSFDGGSVPVLGDPDATMEAARACHADAIAVSDTVTLSAGDLSRLAWQLEGTGIELLVTPAVTEVAGPRISIRPVSSLPLLYVEEPELRGARRLAKVAFDRCCAALALVVLSPVLLAIALLVRLTSPGPAIFKQVRIGLDGRRFVLWKFRTMCVDAEQRLDDVRHLNEHDGLLFKIRDDPRVTNVGRFLRRWSLDEMPQFWNVLRGDMSIVGPRPPLPSEVDRYCDRIRRRLLVKPGITGLWQVNGRANVPWEEAVRLDLYYLENWSPTLDAVILLKTVSAVIRRQGAS